MAINALTADTVVALQQRSPPDVMQSPGTIYAYLALNLRDPILRDIRVRQAIAYAINVQPIIHYLLRDQRARLQRAAAATLGLRCHVEPIRTIPRAHARSSTKPDTAR